MHSSKASAKEEHAILIFGVTRSSRTKPVWRTTCFAIKFTGLLKAFEWPTLTVIFGYIPFHIDIYS
jgi:hypothetical protein